MFIAESFVFTHPPKTGGSFVNDVLKEVFGEIGGAAPKHAVRRDIPEQHQDKPVLTLIREPLSYYTSVWRYGWWIDRDPGDWKWSRWDEDWACKKYADYPYLTFTNFVDAILDIEHRQISPAVRRLAPALPLGQLLLSTLDYACPDPVVALAEQAGEAWCEAEGVAALRRHVADVTFLHTENLQVELRNYLIRQGVPTDQATQACAREPVRPLNTPAGRVLKNGHGQPYDAADRSHLTPKLVADILAAEELILRLFPEYRSPLIGWPPSA